jgi:hypothetical protein
MDNTIEQWVWFYYDTCGFSIIPLRQKDKRPALKTWDKYQDKRATREEIQQWLNEGLFQNIAIICGHVSNDLVVIDFRPMWRSWVGSGKWAAMKHDTCPMKHDTRLVSSVASAPPSNPPPSVLSTLAATKTSLLLLVSAQIPNLLLLLIASAPSPNPPPAALCKCAATKTSSCCS